MEKHILDDCYKKINNNIDISFLGKYKGKIDILMLSGDLLDCFSLSRFSKKFREPLMNEIILGRQLIIDLMKLISPKQTIVNYGNHEQRLINHMSSKLDVDMLGLIPETPLELIIETGFHNFDHKNKTKEYYKSLDGMFPIIYTHNYYHQIGDMIFVHPRNCRNTILGTALRAWEYFKIQGLTFSNIAMAHTHQTSFAKHGSALLYETGALVKPQTYMDGMLSRPQSNGYLLVCQDCAGKTLYDKTRLEIL